MIQGTISSFDRAKLIGFIGTDRGTVFFHREDVVPDVVGRTYLLAGCPVEFQLGIDERGRPKAIHVCDISPQTKMINQRTYEEVGLLTLWNHDGERAHGYAQRPNGEGLFVPGEQCGEMLRPGIRIRYRIGSRTRSSDRKLLWFARDVEMVEPQMPDVPEPVFAPGSVEDYFLHSSGELPVEPSALPEPTDTSVLMLPENRTKSLRQLIAKGRLAS